MKTQIYDLIKKYDLINRTFIYFWESFDNYLKEEPKEAVSYNLINRNSIKTPILKSVKYILTGQKLETENLIITLEFGHTNEKFYTLGYYDCVFSTNGDIDDDFFVIN